MCIKHSCPSVQGQFLPLQRLPTVGKDQRAVKRQRGEQNCKPVQSWATRPSARSLVRRRRLMVQLFKNGICLQSGAPCKIVPHSSIFFCLAFSVQFTLIQVYLYNASICFTQKGKDPAENPNNHGARCRGEEETASSRTRLRPRFFTRMFSDENSKVLMRLHENGMKMKTGALVHVHYGWDSCIRTANLQPGSKRRSILKRFHVKVLNGNMSRFPLKAFLCRWGLREGEPCASWGGERKYKRREQKKRTQRDRTNTMKDRQDKLVHVTNNNNPLQNEIEM